ncbi:MAG: 3-deoxy-manno-octulosonate cytidylyltransferase [Candidatus Lokiarchaeota archaeon]|nr:3-deoxy-manno-octulosonate cytidylyltransferase [Candidatus Lokiarchaeota archaeon]
MNSKKKKIVCIIPARYGSTRLPGKPLADLCGKPVIQWTCEQVGKRFDYIVATDDERIKKAVESFGGKAMMTRKDHVSGSDRIAEVAEKIDADIIVNVQGDEPFINPNQIAEAVAPLLEEPDLMMSTLCRKITSEHELKKLGVVKVVFDNTGNALYFSRSIIPYPRKAEYAKHYEHIGMYVYRKDFLLKYIQWEPTKKELAESLEQLRVLDNGYNIRVIETKYDSGAPCIDTPEDLTQAKKYIEENKLE